MTTETQFVPEWAKGVVWYQIFPERFDNGDAHNDPTLEDIRGAWPHNQSDPWQIHPWTSDWFERQPYEQKSSDDIWMTLHRRRFGGDIQGILNRLDYLQDLGVGALYLNPVFSAPSEHKYDGATFHHIDPTFGPDPHGDRQLMATEIGHDPSTWVWTAADKLMLKLIAEVHNRGMRIIFDGVFNHMGINSWAYQDVVRRQQQSAYADWFKIRHWDDPVAGTVFTHEGWFGVDELPELNQDHNGLVAGPRQYVFDCTERWLAPDGDVSAGIDGWRLDVAFCIKHPFWKDWRRHVRAINPEAYLVAEINRPIAQTQPYLEGDEFDAVMNYNFVWALAEWLVQRNVQISTAQFDQHLHALIDSYPQGVAYVMQNLLDSHDTARFATHCVNRDLFDYRYWAHYTEMARPRHGNIDLRRPTAAERRLQKLAVIMQMTFVGAPMVYYGDEAGMWGANDPDCRRPMVWPDRDYQPRRYQPDGSPRAQPDSVAFDHDLFAFYKELIGIHNDLPPLQRGDFETLLIAEDVYAFTRTLSDETVAIVLNRSETAQSVALPLAAGRYRDLLNDQQVDSDGKLQITVPGIAARILTVA